MACFAGAKRAEKIHRELNKRIDQGGDAILDQVVVKVNAKHKAQVHDPRRTLAGTLTPVLTWGLFGLLAGGLKSLAVWAVVGGICGGLYAYYFEHVATKDELKRIGRRLPADSSALFAFVRGADPRRVLSSAASFEPTTASVAAVAADLSAQVYSGAAEPVETSATPAGAAAAGAAAQDAALDMLMVRFAGEHAARQALAESGSKKHEDQKEPRGRAVHRGERARPASGDRPQDGNRRLCEERHPRLGGVRRGLRVDRGLRRRRTTASSAPSRAGCSPAFCGASSALSPVPCTACGRAVGCPPGGSRGSATSCRPTPPWRSPGRRAPSVSKRCERWAATGSQRLTLRFNPVGHGAVLEV